ncbi:MAG: regulatory protein RecX [Actinomycetales bacterium]|nr:regulatory protein RecX [Actinomycetales bacterium]
MRPTEPTPGSPADQQPEADPEQVARTVLLRRLTAAPRTRQDLRDDLLRRNIPEDVADRVLDRFTDVGLIDDAEYARMWVESRQRSRGVASRVLRQELRRKGVADDEAEAALAGIDPEQERARARELAEAKLRSMSRFAPEVRVRRLTSMLYRRGYSGEVARSVVREVIDDLPDDLSDGLQDEVQDQGPDDRR